jgi:hypothetical protein
MFKHHFCQRIKQPVSMELAKRKRQPGAIVIIASLNDPSPDMRVAAALSLSMFFNEPGDAALHAAFRKNDYSAPRRARDMAIRQQHVSGEKKAAR